MLKPVLLKTPRPSTLFPATQHMTFGTLQTMPRWGWCQMTFRCSRPTIANGSRRLVRHFLSTIRQPAEDFADHAWSILMARLNHDRSPTLHAVVHCSLVIRESILGYRAQPTDSEAIPTMAA